MVIMAQPNGIKFTFGGYGEMHYNQLKGDDVEKRGIDFPPFGAIRWVRFF